MYEAPDILTIGPAHDLILGVKPPKPDNIDSEGWFGFLDRQMDIDEVDE